MRYLLLILITIVIHSCLTKKNIVDQKHQQIIKSDSLKKYTYALMGISLIDNGAIPAMGSGFFIRRNHKLYLITAKHVLIKCEEDKHMPRPTMMNIIVEDSLGEPSIWIPVDVSNIHDNNGCKPDIIAIEVSDNFKANSVENFLHPNFTEVTNVEIFGFPGIEYTKHGDSSFVITKASNLKISEANDKFFQFIGNENHKADTFNFMIKVPNNMIDPFLGNKLNGFSGSPVFIKDAKSEKWRLGGAFVASSEDTIQKETMLFITEIKYAINQINNFN